MGSGEVEGKVVVLVGPLPHPQSHKLAVAVGVGLVHQEWCNWLQESGQLGHHQMWSQAYIILVCQN